MRGDLHQIWRHHLPYPLSIAYKQAATQTTPQQQLFQAFRFGQEVLRFLAYVGMADAMAGSPTAERVERWFGYLQTGTIASFSSLVDSTKNSRAEEDAPFLTELPAVLAMREWKRAVEVIRTERNRFAHDFRFSSLSPSAAREALTKVHSHLQFMRQELRFLERYSMGVFQDNAKFDGGSGLLRLVWFPALGPEERGDPVTVLAPHMVPPASVYLIDSTAEHALGLTPFFTFDTHLAYLDFEDKRTTFYRHCEQSGSDRESELAHPHDAGKTISVSAFRVDRSLWPKRYMLNLEERSRPELVKPKPKPPPTQDPPPKPSSSTLAPTHFEVWRATAKRRSSKRATLEAAKSRAADLCARKGSRYVVYEYRDEERGELVASIDPAPSRVVYAVWKEGGQQASGLYETLAAARKEAQRLSAWRRKTYEIYRRDDGARSHGELVERVVVEDDDVVERFAVHREGRNRASSIHDTLPEAQAEAQRLSDLREVPYVVYRRVRGKDRECVWVTRPPRYSLWKKGGKQATGVYDSLGEAKSEAQRLSTWRQVPYSIYERIGRDDFGPVCVMQPETPSLEFSVWKAGASLPSGVFEDREEAVEEAARLATRRKAPYSVHQRLDGEDYQPPLITLKLEYVVWKRGAKLPSGSYGSLRKARARAQELAEQRKADYDVVETIQGAELGVVASILGPGVVRREYSVWKAGASRPSHVVGRKGEAKRLARELAKRRRATYEVWLRLDGVDQEHVYECE